MKLESSRSLLIRLFTLAVLVLVPPMAIVSVRALGQFEQGMIPELDKKAAAIGRDLTAQVERAVAYGIPIEKLVGVDDFFAPVLEANPELRYLAVTGGDGKVLFLKGAERAELEPHTVTAEFPVAGEARKSTIGPYLDLALAINTKEGAVGQVHVGFDQNYIATRLHDIIYDIVLVMAVSLIVAFEILLFVVFYNITGPMKLVGWVIDQARRGDFTHMPGVLAGDEVGRFVRSLNGAIRLIDEKFRSLMAYVDEVRTAHFDKGVVGRVEEIAERVRFLYRFAPAGKPMVERERQAADIRLPLFLFVFAEEMSRSFMPLYAREVGTSFPGLTPEMIMAIPIAVFMAFIAIASPWAGRITEKIGSRKVFLIGLVPAVMGYGLTATAMGVVDLVLWRAVTGLGYAIVTVAAQTYISKSVRGGGRAQGLGVYVGAVLTASICGTAFGGLLAERFGYQAAFLASAVLVLLSGLLVHRLVAAEETAEAGPAKPRQPMLTLFRNWRFTVLMLFAAVPSKMALTGFLFFLLPVTLTQADLDLAAIARIIVLYPLVMAGVSFLASRLADRLGGWRAGLVALGGLIGGAGLMAPLAFDGTAPIVIAIVALGISHGLSASPQLALIPDVCWTECRAWGQTNVMAFVRTIERVGSTLGPLLAAAFIPLWGGTGAVVALGVVVLVMAVVFAAASRAYGAGPHIETEEAA